jgi:hypothetical protein
MQPHHSWAPAPVTQESRQTLLENLSEAQASEAKILTQELLKGPSASKISEIHLNCVPVYDA